MKKSILSVILFCLVFAMSGGFKKTIKLTDTVTIGRGSTQPAVGEWGPYL